jgi:hypothetical protein
MRCLARSPIDAPLESAPVGVGDGLGEGVGVGVGEGDGLGEGEGLCADAGRICTGISTSETATVSAADTTKWRMNFAIVSAAQHAVGIDVVIDHGRDRRIGIGILRDGAEPRCSRAGRGEGPRRVVGLLDGGFAVRRSDHGGVTGLRQVDTLEAQVADARITILQHHDALAALMQNIEGGAADPDGRQRCRDLVGGLLRMPGDEAKCASGQPDRDLAVAVLVVEDGAVELERRIGTERQIGAVGHHQPRRAGETGVYDFVAQQAVADIDLAGRRSRHADDFILDHGRFADARLRASRACRKPRQAQRGNAENAVTPIHFNAD